MDDADGKHQHAVRRSSWFSNYPKGYFFRRKWAFLEVFRVDLSQVVLDFLVSCDEVSTLG